MITKINFISALIIVAVAVGCKKEGTVNTNDLYVNSPATAIPAELKGGLWFWGGFGPVSYYDDNGHEVGNETEAARQYSFSEVAGKGRVEFIQYLGLRNASDCVTEIYTTKKGTIVFEGADKLIFYPVEGNFKTIKKGCSDDGTSVRNATAEELQPETYLWEAKTIENQSLLYIYNADDVNKLDPVFVYEHAE